MTPQEILTKEFLDNNYTQLNKSILDISKETGFGASTVSRYLRKHQIIVRKPTTTKRSKPGDIIGKKFNGLYVTGPLVVIKTNSRKIWKYRCICDCGKEHYAVKYSLISGKTKSCGCSAYDGLYTGFGDLSGSYWKIVKSNALMRELDFTITIEYAWNLFLEQDKKCAITNLDIFLSKSLYKSHKKTAPEQTASLDRIDNTKGYIEGNVWWVHKDINWMKNDMNMEEFTNYCNLVVCNYNNTRMLYERHTKSTWIN